jgi:hypothetical protein
MRTRTGWTSTVPEARWTSTVPEARWTISARALAVVLALAIATFLVLFIAVGRRAAPAVGHGARHQTTGGPIAPAAPRAQTLRLVTGSGWVNGVYTNYPRTQVGAVSAAVEFLTEIGSTLSPDRAATVARLAADRSYLAAANDAAASAIAARRALGLPTTGLLPPGTAAFLVPVMYQLRAVSANGLTVLLLSDYTLTAPSGVAEHLGVTAVRLTWTQGGWRLLRPPAVDLAALFATPGTGSATAKGWKAMTHAL